MVIRTSTLLGKSEKYFKHNWEIVSSVLGTYEPDVITLYTAMNS